MVTRLWEQWSSRRRLWSTLSRLQHLQRQDILPMYSNEIWFADVWKTKTPSCFPKIHNTLMLIGECLDIHPNQHQNRQWDWESTKHIIVNYDPVCLEDSEEYAWEHLNEALEGHAYIEKLVEQHMKSPVE